MLETTTQNPIAQAHERYARAIWQSQQTSQQRLSELATQYASAIQSANEDIKNRVADAYNKYTEALREATSNNDIIQRCKDAAQRYAEAVQHTRAELQSEKTVADLRYMTALYEAQGQPDAQRRCQSALEQYLSSFQEIYKRSSVSEATEACSAYQQGLKEASEYGRRRVLEAQAALGEALRTAYTEAAQTSQTAVETYIKGQQQAWVDAQESTKRAGVEILQELQSYAQRADSNPS